MSNQHYLFLRNIILIIGLCIVATALHAQDTNTVHPAKAVQKAGEKTSLKNDSAFTFRHVEKTNNSRKGKKQPPARKVSKDTTAVIPAQNAPPKSKDTGGKKATIGSTVISSTVNTKVQGKDKASQHTGTPLAAGAAISAPLALPSFTGKPFGHYNAFINYLLTHNSIFKNTAHPLPDIATLRNGSEMLHSGAGLFYTIIGVLFFLAILRLSFTKYFSDLFRAFFSPALSQRQLRDQLSQTPFPALLLNIFFGLSAGLYLFLILRHFNFITTSRPLFLIPVFMLLIILIYLFKYIFLRFSGWLFGYRDAASGYVFTLYMVNKVMGIILLPFILILAFSTPVIAGIALNISLIVVLLLFIYRYIRVYALVRNQIFLNKFHFFIYLCGFEIAPVLIIGKLVLIWLNGA